MDKKRLVIYIIVSVVVAALASFITFQVLTNQETKCEDDHMAKFGVSIKLKRDPNAQDYSTAMYQNATSFRAKIDAIVTAPRPGETKHFDFAEAEGKFSYDCKADCNATISFDNDMFVENGVFNCPLVFYLGKNSNGDSIVVDGQNYISKKHEFMTAIQYAFDEQDREFIPKGTDIKNTFDYEGTLFKVEYPKDRANAHADENSTFKFDYSFCVERND